MKPTSRRDFLKYTAASGTLAMAPSLLQAQTPSSLSPKQREAIAQLWQDEKLTWDLAQAWGKEYDIELLKTIGNWSALNRKSVLNEIVKLYNIDLSETQDAKLLYSTEQIINMPSGEFASTKLQERFDTLKSQGLSSLKDALLNMVKLSVDNITKTKEYIGYFAPTEKAVQNLIYLNDSSMGHYWALNKELLKIGVKKGCCEAGSEYCKSANEYTVSYGRDHISDPKALNSEQRHALAHMWSEEKMAHDAFETVYTVYPHLRLFYNIGHWSEVQHLSAVEELIALYDIDINDYDNSDKHYDKDTLANMGPGDYAISDFEDRYQNVLLPYAVQSDIAALQLGCMVEVQDVRDLTQFLGQNDNPYIDRTFKYLIEGSQTHYWAYHYALIQRGVSEGCCSAGKDYCKDTVEFPAGSGQEELAMRWNRFDIPLDGFGKKMIYA